MTVESTAVPSWFSDAIATPPEHGRISVEGAAVAYRTWGEDGKPGVLLVHGGAAHAGWWDHLAPQLATTHKVVAVDLSGHGNSEWRDDLYTYSLWAAELVAVTRETGIDDDRLVVVGHSMGGIVTLFASVLFPEVVDNVVIVDSELFTAEDIAALMVRGAESSIPQGTRYYSSREEALGRYRLLPEQDSLPYVREHVALGSMTSDEQGWRWKFDRQFPMRLTDPAPTPPPTCTVTVVRGERGIMNSQRAQALVDGRPGPARLVTLAGGGHHVMLDRPLELLAEIRTTLGYGEATEE